MSIVEFIHQVKLVLRSYDKNHHRTALMDSIGAVSNIIMTSLLWFVLVYFAPSIPTSYYLIVSGIIRGLQLFFGIVLMASLLGFIFDTFSPYRHLLSSVIGALALGFCLVTQMDELLSRPEFFGMALTLFIACYLSVSVVLRILVSESSFASKWREMTNR
jgi:hypothetical protein